MMSTKQIMIFGASESNIDFVKQLEKEGKQLVAWVDNNHEMWGKKIYGKPIIAPHEIEFYKYDKIIVYSISGYRTINTQLLDMGISPSRIDCDVVRLMTEARERFVRDLSLVFLNNNVAGNVAEAGVYQGDFSCIINDSFKSKKLYLFDTFKGFEERDVVCEQENCYSNATVGQLSDSSIDLVNKKLPYPQNVKFVQGYFPESARGINEKYCYVNIDFDLFKPTKAALEFFWPQMVEGGVITIHDYFTTGYKGIKTCVDSFANEIGRIPFPIGDGISIAIQK